MRQIPSHGCSVPSWCDEQMYKHALYYLSIQFGIIFPVIEVSYSLSSPQDSDFLFISVICSSVMCFSSSVSRGAGWGSKTVRSLLSGRQSSRRSPCLPNVLSKGSLDGFSCKTCLDPFPNGLSVHAVRQNRMIRRNSTRLLQGRPCGCNQAIILFICTIVTLYTYNIVKTICVLTTDINPFLDLYGHFLSRFIWTCNVALVCKCKKCLNIYANTPAGKHSYFPSENAN